MKFPAALLDVKAREDELVVPASFEMCCTNLIGLAAFTVKGKPLLARPLTLTTTLPVVAPAGTGAAMLVSLQLVGVAAVPLNVIVLVPWDAPKPAPLIVIEVPTVPAVGLRLARLGPGVTV